jgi:hypothetical protein
VSVIWGRAVDCAHTSLPVYASSMLSVSIRQLTAVGLSPLRPPALSGATRDLNPRRADHNNHRTSFRQASTRTCTSALNSFIGGLLAILPGTLAVRGVPGGQCAVCKSCKGFICRVLSYVVHSWWERSSSWLESYTVTAAGGRESFRASRQTGYRPTTTTWPGWIPRNAVSASWNKGR